MAAPISPYVFNIVDSKTTELATNPYFRAAYLNEQKNSNLSTFLGFLGGIITPIINAKTQKITDTVQEISSAEGNAAKLQELQAKLAAQEAELKEANTKQKQMGAKILAAGVVVILIVGLMVASLKKAKPVVAQVPAT
jgi:hypothetical protein